MPGVRDAARDRGLSTAARPFEVVRDGVTLRGEEAGEGPAVLLLHGLSAMRRYVVHGSRALERAGRRVIAFDARGHGASDPAGPPEAYTYDELVADAVAVLDDRGVDRALVAGQSMGAATAAALALQHPGRVAALALITPAHLGAPSSDLARWDRLAEGLERGGPEGFLEALGEWTMDERFRDTVRTFILQRMARHQHPEAVAQALRGVPRTAAFDGVAALEAIAAPTLVVGSRDAADPDHPLEIGREWTRRIPGGRLVVEGPEESPLAWRGGALSRELLSLG